MANNEAEGQRENRIEINIGPALKPFAALQDKLKMNEVALRASGVEDRLLDSALEQIVNEEPLEAAWEMVMSTFLQCIEAGDTQGYYDLQQQLFEYEFIVDMYSVETDFPIWKQLGEGVAAVADPDDNTTGVFNASELPTTIANWNDVFPENEEEFVPPTGVLVLVNYYPPRTPVIVEATFYEQETDTVHTIRMRRPGVPNEFYQGLALVHVDRMREQADLLLKQ